MSDDIGSKLQQLKDMLDNEGLSDNLQNMLGVLSQGSQHDEHKSSMPNLGNLGMAFDKDAPLFKIKKLLDKRRDLDDPRINLLNAIKPYVSNKRQQRIDNCSKLLNMTMLTRILNEEDL